MSREMISTSTRRQVSEWARLTQKKFRRERGQFLIEGEICVREALAARAPLEAVVVAREHLARFETLIRSASKQIFVANAQDFARLSSVDTSQGILAIGKFFDGLRTDYPARREFSSTVLTIRNASPILLEKLKGIGFEIHPA